MEICCCCADLKTAVLICCAAQVVWFLFEGGMALNAARHQDASRYSNGMPDSALKLLTFWGVWAMIFVLPMCVVGTIASLTMKGDYKTITMRCAKAYFWMSALNTLIVLSVGLAVKGSERYHIQEERVKNDEDNGGTKKMKPRVVIFRGGTRSGKRICVVF